MDEMQLDPDKKCCQNCKYFEERTGFCRKNPPKAIQITTGKNPYCVAMFPKIGMPFLDFCFEFKKK